MEMNEHSNHAFLYMDAEKLIVFGCDDTENLAIIMNSLKQCVFFNYNIITTTRVADLARIAGSMTPELIILCFRSCQSVLNDYNSFVKKQGTPILCITKKFEDGQLYWAHNCIVFTFPLANAKNASSLNSAINSIFLLRPTLPAGKMTDSLAEAARQASQENSNRNMSRIVLELDQKVDVLTKVKDSIVALFPRVDDPVRAELIHIANSIKNSVGDNKLWEDFKLYFVKTNPDFLSVLAQKFPSLTQVDLKYCCYLRMNMANDDIRTLLGINQESVRTHKYRLKKKLSLSREESLRRYLQSLQ